MTTTENPEVTAAPGQPSIQDRIAGLLPPHTYFWRGIDGITWQWTTPTGIWSVAVTGDFMSVLIGPLGPASLTLRRSNGIGKNVGSDVDVSLPRTEEGFGALSTLLQVLGAVEA